MNAPGQILTWNPEIEWSELLCVSFPRLFAPLLFLWCVRLIVKNAKSRKEKVKKEREKYKPTLNWQAGGVGHGPRDQFCPITSLQMADWFFHLCAGSLFDFLRFSPFIKWFTIIFFGKVWVDRCSKPQFLKQYDVCLFSIDIVRCNSSCT